MLLQAGAISWKIMFQLMFLHVSPISGGGGFCRGFAVGRPVPCASMTYAILPARSVRSRTTTHKYVPESSCLVY